MMTRLVLAVLALLLAAAPAFSAEVTDEEVSKAIAKGKEFLLGLQNVDGSFTNDPQWRGCYSALITMTLGYMGEHPNRPAMQKALNYVCNLSPDRDFAGKEGYAVPIRIMAMSYVYPKIAADKQAGVRKLMQEDIARLLAGQNPGIGGWRYKLNKADYDFSASQWPILSMYEASRIGVEFPRDSLLKAKTFYCRGQRADGGWGYLISMTKSYGSMTAAGAASLFTIQDLVEPGSGCPCRAGASQKADFELDRRIDSALGWLAENFDTAKNPGWEFKTNFDELYYWLYSAERVGIMAGFKYFGHHNWYKEGADGLVRRQRVDGSWMQIDPKARTGIDAADWGGGQIPDTCFALLFLYKGRAPVLFNKLRFDGVWNPHRRDLANLTRYVEWAKEQQFHWQIVDLAAPVEELHDAPILYVCAETPPKWTAAERQKLRRFTDTGGTIFLEASCGAPAVRKWAVEFAKEVWPEWPLEALPEDHPVFVDPYPLAAKQRPELLGIHDGVRTLLFYSPDDVSCAWHTKAFAQREYLFKWGIDLFTVATDRAPLRAKLAAAPPPENDRYSGEVRAGPRPTVRVGRLRHSGNWEVGANYGSFETLAARLVKKANVGLKVLESSAPPVNKGGLAATNLQGCDVAYLAGNKVFTLEPAERDALKAFLARGGFLWAEDVGGLDWGEHETPAGKVEKFDEALRQLAADLGLTLAPLAPTHPILSGKMNGAAGYDLSTGIGMRRALRMKRAAMTHAQIIGLSSGEKLVGVYSPYDVMFSMNDYEAYNCKGYKPADAEAVATNIVLYLTTPGGDAPAAPPEKPPPEEKTPAEKEPGTKLLPWK